MNKKVGLALGTDTVRFLDHGMSSIWFVNIYSVVPLPCVLRNVCGRSEIDAIISAHNKISMFDSTLIYRRNIEKNFMGAFPFSWSSMASGKLYPAGCYPLFIWS